MTEPFHQTWRAHGEQLASDPGQWEFHSRMLIQGADALWEKHKRAAEGIGKDTPAEELRDVVLVWPALFLAANAVEVLVKALALQHSPDAAQDGRLYSHDLPALASGLAGLALAESEAELLRKVSRWVIWVGRYPTPKWHQEKFRSDYDVVGSQDADGTFQVDGQSTPWNLPWDEVRQSYLALSNKFAERGAQGTTRAT